MQTWDLTFLTKWIKVHAEDAAAMGKPLIVEEFGKQVRMLHHSTMSRSHKLAATRFASSSAFATLQQLPDGLAYFAAAWCNLACQHMLCISGCNLVHPAANHYYHLDAATFVGLCMCRVSLLKLCLHRIFKQEQDC